MFNYLVNELDERGWEYIIERKDNVKVIEFYMGNSLQKFSDKFLNSLDEEFCMELIEALLEW